MYLVSGGGGYDTSLPPSELWDHVHPTSACAKGVNHFLMTRLAPGECRVQAIDTEDQVMDDVVLTKAPGDIAPLPPASPQLAYPIGPEEGVSVAGMEEGQARWVLPRTQYATDPDVTHDDGLAVRWENEGAPVVPAIRRALVDDGHAYRVAAGKSYEVSAWVKTEDVCGGVTASLSWNGDMGFLGRAETAPVEGTKDWTRVSVRTPPMPERVYWCRVVLSAKPGSRGQAWFDGVSVTEV